MEGGEYKTKPHPIKNLGIIYPHSPPHFLKIIENSHHLWWNPIGP